ncbi:unnamed protein product [Ilex paraguariensis]|uniref:Transmembrane protein n=1 Tax=Ilex paraguariensis TaxID=185542 RepID=A0ABC8R8Z6_9AQUA
MVAKVFGVGGGLDNVDFEGVISVEAVVTVAWAWYDGSFGVLCDGLGVFSSRFWGWGVLDGGKYGWMVFRWWWIGLE